MRLSYPAGHALIFREEAIILVAYNDGYGEWKTHGTIGAGHTSVAGPPVVVPGQRITLDEAIAIFNSDIARVEADVNRIIKVPLNQTQFDALVSFHYNTGGLTERACALRDQINAGRMDGEGFSHFEKAGNDPHALHGRREREQLLFTTGQYGDMRVPVYDNWNPNGHNRARLITLPPLPGAVLPPEVHGDPHVGKGGAGPPPDVILNENGTPGLGPAGPTPMARSTTVWASISAFLVSGGGYALSYLQQVGPAIVAILVVGALVGWIIYQRYQHKKLTGV